jgi:hypothetical protein
VTNSYGGDSDTVLKLPKLLTRNPAINNINIMNTNLVIGKNGGKLGEILQDIFGWINNVSDSFVSDVCKKLNITKEQYDKLVEDSFNEMTYTFPEVCFHRICAQKKIFKN